MLLGAVAILAGSPGLAAQEVPASRASGPIEVDGVLDEADWSRAATVGDFTQLQPVADAPAGWRYSPPRCGS